MTALSNMPNIDKEMESKLKSVEIESAEHLVEIGAKKAFFRLKLKYPQVCLVHLYTLEAAIQNVEFNCLSEEIKRDLKAFSDSLNNMIELYFSGTGNTKHCSEYLLKLLDENAITNSIEGKKITNAIQSNDEIIFAYPVYYSYLPKIVGDFIIGNSAMWKDKKNSL